MAGAGRALHVNGVAINACLSLAVMHDGDEITTIEGLSQGGTLHPVQQAFWDHDAYQCGYCTAGQMMSAVGVLGDKRIPTDDAAVREAMSGNICRCGAYRNIVAAVQDARGKMKRLAMRTFEYARAADVEQAIVLHARAPETAYLAGGTTLLDLMKLDVMHPPRVVDIHKLGLNQVEVAEDGRVRIGAMVSNTELARHPHIVKHHPALSQALLSGASTQLRDKATTAGNVMQRVRCGYFRDGVSPCNKREPGSGCPAIDGLNRNVHAVLGGSNQCIAAHPSDMCVAMVAIGATIHVQGPKGRRDIPFADFTCCPVKRRGRSTRWRPTR